MAGFILKNTLSENGGVTRGVCEVDSENYLVECNETKNIQKVGNKVSSDAGELDENSYVSMNEAIAKIRKYKNSWDAKLFGLNLSDKTDATKWGFVIFSHHCISIFKHVTSVLTAYKNGTSGVFNITTNGVPSAVNYDFTSISRGEIICAVHGHNHNFIYKKISNENWNAITEENAWLWSICIPNMDTTRNNEAAHQESNYPK